MRTISIIKRLIFLQLIIICFLYFNVHNKKNNALGSKTNIIPINKNIIQQVKTQKLKCFYNLKPNEIATWSAEFLPKPIVNKYNNDSLNDTQNYSVNKESDTFRIITLGDSYTYGQNVNTKDNWTELLETKLNKNLLCKNINKFEVINLGVFGYDIEYEVERYKQLGQKYNPDLIIWTLVDADRLNEIRIPSYDECDQKNQISKTNNDCWNYSIKKTIDNYGISKIIEKQKQAIIDLKKIYNKPIFFIDYYNKHQEIIKEINNSTIFNKLLTKNYLLKDHTYKEVHFPDNHPNELGHKIIADIIFNQLFETNQIPCEILEQK